MWRVYLVVYLTVAAALLWLVCVIIGLLESRVRSLAAKWSLAGAGLSLIGVLAGVIRFWKILHPLFLIWTVLAMMATSGLLMAWSIWRRPFPAGSCQGCGYDLTGNISGVCPECGRNAGSSRGVAKG